MNGLFNMKKINWVSFEWLGMLFLVLAVISFSIAFTINFRLLYVFDIDFLNISSDVSMDKATILRNFDQLMMYLNNPFVQTLSLNDFSVSESGAFHFYEVKRLFMICYSVFIVTIVPSVSFMNYLVKNNRLWRLIRTCQYGMIIPILLFLFMVIGFDQFFVLFHGVLFNNNDWLFNPTTDPIINVLPEMFFMHCFVLFFVLLEFLFLLGIVLGKKELKKVS